MKIFHILDHSLPLHSGYTFRSQNLFNAQKQRGITPVVLTSPKHEQSASDTDSMEMVIDGVQYYRTGRLSFPAFPLVSELVLMRRLFQRILQVSAIEKPDMLHVHSPVLNGLPAIRAARKIRIPVVYEIRAFWEDAAVDHGTYTERSWKYQLTRWLETRVCQMADHVFILCGGLKQDLVRRGIPESKVTPIFNGVDTSGFVPRAPDQALRDSWGLKDKKVIGFIGSFYRYEGLDLLITAFERFSRAREDWRLVLVGGGEMAAELKCQADRLGIADRVFFPGRIPHGRIGDVYSVMDILAYPRYPMRLTELVTPLKPLEAMAMGKALVASDVGGHRELIRHGETGYLFKAGDPHDLTRALALLADDVLLREQLERTGEKWVRTYHTWQETTAGYYPVYGKLLRQK